MGYITLSLIKVVDNIISTAKSIATYQERKILSSILVAISQLIFYLVIDQVVNDGSLLVIFIVAISSGVGNFIAFSINDKFKRDEKWTVALTCSDINDVRELCHYLRRHGIKYLANDGYDKECKKTINVLAFSKTKEESSLIDLYLESTDNKYFKEVLK
jgi:hypothetical protein